MYVLKNCRLIKELTEGSSLTQADLYLENGKIQKIAPCGSETKKEDEVLDVKGATVMPGLIEGHTHLRAVSRTKLTDGRIPCAVAYDVIRFAKFFLDHGYTTVRDMGDNVATPAIHLRNAVNEGKFVGPRIFSPGPTLVPTEFGNDADWSVPNHYDVNGPEEMRKMVRFCLQKGSDFIKLYGSGSMMVMNGKPGALIMEEDEMREAVKITGRKNTYCAIHMHGTEGCELAARAGVRTIEHASFISEHTLKYLETKKAEGQGIVLTLSCLEELGENARFNGDVIKKRKEEIFSHLRKTKDYDILIGWGTDTSMEFYDHDPYAEFRMRKEILGFSNLEILKQVTVDTARLMMKDDVIGTVKEGKYADLAVIDGNPDEDLSAMYRRPLHVIKGGELVY